MTDHNANPSERRRHRRRIRGTLAANHLRMRADVNITLVNPRPKFVERIRLHQHVAGNYDATVDYGTLLGEGVTLVVDSADAYRHRCSQSGAWRRASRWTTTT